MARQKSVNGSKKILKSLNTLMKDLDKKVSIRVGIIGSQAYEKHPHSDLTMAHLGAIHEFGATIQVTEKMRAYLHHIGVHLKSETTTITIPARSFLRDTFFTGDAKERLMDFAGLSENAAFNKEYFEMKMAENPEFFMDVCKAIGAKALEMVQDSFRAGGYPTQWQPISEITRKNRIADPNNPPLQDTGDLMDSITVEVKEV
jgi:phage gpG-like protein